jgi:hypothetical protein
MFTTRRLNLFTNFQNPFLVERTTHFNEYLTCFIDYSYFLTEYLTI